VKKKTLATILVMAALAIAGSAWSFKDAPQSIPKRQASSGTVLIREWRGVSHRVTNTIQAQRECQDG
jgi:hypothetical protein